jgi:transcription termination factor NusB
MSIIQKVKSRKIAFLYYYQLHFISGLEHYDIFDHIHSVDQMAPIQDTNHTNQKSNHIVHYIASIQLGYQNTQYDDKLAQLLVRSYKTYQHIMSTIIQPYTTTFGFDDMNAIEQAIIHLWYTEYMIIHTPYKVIIDQMVEIAKRYSTTSSAKLINGILHALFSSCEASTNSSPQ